MEIKVKVSQAAAVRRGEMQHGDVAVAIESWEGWTAQERDELAGLLARSGGDVIRADIAPTLGALRELCAELAARREAESRAAKELAAAISEAPRLLPDLARAQLAAGKVEVLLLADYRAPGGVRVPSALQSYVFEPGRIGDVRGADAERLSSDPRSVACAVPPDVAAALTAEVARRDAVALAEREANEARVRAARELEQARLDERLELLLEVATEEQRARMDAGFLGDREIDAILRDAIFAPLCVRRRYGSLTYDDELLCDPDGDLDEYGHEHMSDADVCYSVEDARELTSMEFAKFREFDPLIEQIKTTLPEATVAVTPRRHVMECGRRDCNARHERLGVLVEVRLPAGSEFSREFMLGVPDNLTPNVD